MAKDDEGTGFKVTDRRHFVEGKAADEDKEKGKITESEKKTDEKKEQDGQKEQIPLPEMNFSTFLFSLNSSAFFHLGEIPDPTTNKKERNLPMAKQTIDIISMLKEKTKGNLADDEEKFMEHILYDLRMRYVEAMKRT